jgi:hypothetical protein
MLASRLGGIGRFHEKYRTLVEYDMEMTLGGAQGFSTHWNEEWAKKENRSMPR